MIRGLLVDIFSVSHENYWYIGLNYEIIIHLVSTSITCTCISSHGPTNGEDGGEARLKTHQTFTVHFGEFICLSLDHGQKSRNSRCNIRSTRSTAFPHPPMSHHLASTGTSVPHIDWRVVVTLVGCQCIGYWCIAHRLKDQAEGQSLIYLL